MNFHNFMLSRLIRTVSSLSHAIYPHIFIFLRCLYVCLCISCFRYHSSLSFFSWFSQNTFMSSFATNIPVNIPVGDISEFFWRACNKQQSSISCLRPSASILVNSNSPEWKISEFPLVSASCLVITAFFCYAVYCFYQICVLRSGTY